jgi:hypothetical protein
MMPLTPACTSGTYKITKHDTPLVHFLCAFRILHDSHKAAVPNSVLVANIASVTSLFCRVALRFAVLYDISGRNVIMVYSGNQPPGLVIGKISWEEKGCNDGVNLNLDVNE